MEILQSIRNFHDFSSAIEYREDADHRYTHSEETAADIIEDADKFIAKMQELLKEKK